MLKTPTTSRASACRRYSLTSTLMVALLWAGAGGVSCPEAAGQEIMVSSRIGPGGFGGSGQISRRAVEKYAGMLGLGPEQREAAMTMHSGYAAAYAARQKAMREALDEVRRAADDSGDHSVFMERMPAIQKENREATTKLEKEFFSDLKSLLDSAAQEEKWPRVERARRREVGLRQGQMSGESVDLIEVVGTLSLKGEPARSVGQVLDSYEIELDQQLVAREAARGDTPVFEPGKPIDLEKLEKQMAESREAGRKICDVNQQNARKIEGLLPDGEREAFKSAYRKACFPRVYRESRTAKELDAALQFSDLDATQREEIASMKEAYSREIGPVNAAWAAAVEEHEKSGNAGGMSSGGAAIFMSNGDEPQALKDARKSRRELDEKYASRLRSTLRPDQKEKLPKTFEGDEPEMLSGQRMMMIRENR